MTIEVSILDLLGTAGVQASMAKTHIEALRGEVGDPLARIRDAHNFALELLVQVEVARNYIETLYSRGQLTRDELGYRSYSFEDNCDAVKALVLHALDQYD